MDPNIATAPKTQSRSKDQNKDKDNSKQNQEVKLNIVKPESFTQKVLSRIVGNQNRVSLALVTNENNVKLEDTCQPF